MSAFATITRLSRASLLLAERVHRQLIRGSRQENEEGEESKKGMGEKKERAHDNRFGSGQRFKLFNMFNYSQADDPGS